MKPLSDIAQTDAQVLLDVRFTGASFREPDIGALTSALSVNGGRVSFVHGGIDRIQGHAQGRLIFATQLQASAANNAQAQIASLLEHVRGYANHVEVLGYV